MQMKHVIIAVLFLLTIISGVILSNTGKANTSTVVITISNAQTEKDYQKIEAVLTDSSQVVSVKADQEKHQIEVSYNPDNITRDKILQLIKNAGYTPHIVKQRTPYRQKPFSRGCCSF